MARDYDVQGTKTHATTQSTTQARIDEGLRSYMLRVYNYMVGGLAITGAIAYYTSVTPTLLNAILNSGLMWVVMLAPLGFILFLSFGINRMSATTAQIVFWIYSGVMGLSMASIFIAYPIGNIARVFFITAGTFGAMSLYGYTTKRDLTAFGSFLFMGLIGILIASVVNIFLASSMMNFVISIIGVLVFTGLTAFDTQKIKAAYSSGYSAEIQTKQAIIGALRLYLDFVNLFIMLLRLFGGRR